MGQAVRRLQRRRESRSVFCRPRRCEILETTYDECNKTFVCSSFQLNVPGSSFLSKQHTQQLHTASLSRSRAKTPRKPPCVVAADTLADSMPTGQACVRLCPLDGTKVGTILCVRRDASRGSETKERPWFYGLTARSPATFSRQQRHGHQQTAFSCADSVAAGRKPRAPPGQPTHARRDGYCLRVS